MNQQPLSNQKIDATIAAFIQWHIDHEKVDPLDRIYLTNQLLELLKKKELSDPESSNELFHESSHLTMLDDLVEYAVEVELIEDSASARDVFGAKIMDVVTPRPSEVNNRFWQLYAKNQQLATNDFYTFSEESNYIKTREIAKNIEYTHPTEYGDLEITINLSKPEKDPKKIAAAKQTQYSYPVNALCMENEGYAGHESHAGRSNHRIIRLEVAGEPWGFQYSPYAYYNEHAIFLSEEHRGMNVGERAIKNLLDILTILPHYFVGSNAGLPIVGGSILSHDHYQGGQHTFALERAEMEETFQLKDLPQVKAGLVKWPMSVIRLSSKDQSAMEQAAKKVMETWDEYDDPSVDIQAYTGTTPHNAVTPIARMREDQFELDLVLRNNRTTQQYPDGLFHPHPDVQHIKKENIGLIEVMGLAILPPRLERELAEVKAFLMGEVETVDPIHQPWADTLKEPAENLSSEQIDLLIQQSVGDIFLKVLKDAGVFKRTEKGQSAFLDFVERLKTV